MRTFGPLVLSSFLRQLNFTKRFTRNHEFRYEAKAPWQPVNLANTCGLYGTAPPSPYLFPLQCDLTNLQTKLRGADASRRSESLELHGTSLIKLHGGRMSPDTKQRLRGNQQIWQTLVDCTKHVRPFLSLFPCAFAISRSRHFEKKKHVLLCRRFISKPFLRFSSLDVLEIHIEV